MGAVGSEWGEWVLGDLSDALSELAGLVGNSTEVTWIKLRTPIRVGATPEIVVAVPDRGDLFRIHSDLAESGHPVAFDDVSEAGWGATLPGLARLRVEADQ